MHTSNLFEFLFSNRETMPDQEVSLKLVSVTDLPTCPSSVVKDKGDLSMYWISILVFSQPTYTPNGT